MKNTFQLLLFRLKRSREKRGEITVRILLGGITVFKLNSI